MKSWDEIKALMENKEIHMNDYVVLVPQELYERLIDETVPKVEENMIPYLYSEGLRIMWDAHIKKPLLVTKDLYNVEYNPSSSIKLV